MVGELLWGANFDRSVLATTADTLKEANKVYTNLGEMAATIQYKERDSVRIPGRN